MADKNFTAPSEEVEWEAEVDAGKYGLYRHEKGDCISEEVAIRRGRGVIVVAQTAFYARQLGACALGLAPEHVKVTQCEMNRRGRRMKVEKPNG